MHKRCCVIVQICGWAIAGLFFLHSSVCAATNELSAIRAWSSPTSTRIVLDIKQRALYQTPSPPKPELLIIDLIDFFGPAPVSTITVNDGIVKTVTAARTDRRTIRITIALEKPAAPKIFQMERYLDMPPRLAIDFIRQDLEQADHRYREETRKLKKKELRIVVLDPGHGGDDPGAISPNGLREKNIVLSVERKIARKLNKKPGIKAYLTRTGDYFIPLSTRTRIAREYGADLFVSIHADSNFSTELQGTSVYCLSLKGASDNTAEMLAQKENASDSIGGVPLDHNNNDINAIIIDLVQTHTFNSSMLCADILLKEVSKVNAVLRDRPQHAGFKVLRDPDIPLVTLTDSAMYEVIGYGRPNAGMPPYGVSYGGELSTSEISYIVTFMRYMWDDRFEIPAEALKPLFPPLADGEVPSYDVHIAPIVKRYCISCHRPGKKNNNYDDGQL